MADASTLRLFVLPAFTTQTNRSADAFEDGDGALITAAMHSVAQAPGLGELAAAVGMPRDTLQAALQADEFDLDLTLEIMKVVDLHMSSGRA